MAGKQSPMRMFIMLPMIFLMGKIDFENETTLMAARTAFFVCQATALLVGLYLKQLIERKHDTRKIFVPGPKSPFDQSPNYAELTETTYEAHELAKANEFIKQTLIGAGISSLIHFKMGVNHVVMIQSVMMPMNLWDNPLVQAYLLGRRNGRIWNERLEGESAEEAAAAAGVDAPTAAAAAAPAAAAAEKEGKSASPEEAIAAALAAGADADFDALWTAVKAKVNAKTDEDQWTALMVACGSPVDTDDFIKKVVKAGADVLAVDGDGWTALHWSAFHGRPEAAEALLSSISAAKREQLLAVKASDGCTAAEVAKREENGDVVEVLAGFSSQGGDSKDEDSTLRQRKAGASSVEDVD
ncbi:Protein involved in inorganic phosphate transport [Phytophthora cinnamomi]|uniref:Protein involved in inorganic phosphate transport n=1 Tax=Phytophthora cinnamomi TaxID=4785 RepID=UPI00355A8CEA|nr:Protein involved in inorganic phosphate transport [Phytophthora cinnamomi]